jgi:hypothetical protein
MAQDDNLIEASRHKTTHHPLEITDNIARAMVNTCIKLVVGE